MAEKLDNQTTVDPAPTPEPAVSEPDLAADVDALKRLNLLKAVLVRMNGGRHPVAEVDALLRRRMNFSRHDFQGPYLIRLFSTWMMIFIVATLFWSVLWILSSGFELNYFVRILSTGMATLVAAMAGIAIFHPSSLPDESLLRQAIDDRLKELKVQIGENTEDDAAAPDLVDANLQDSKNQEKPGVGSEPEPLPSMPAGLHARQAEMPLADDEIIFGNQSRSTDVEMNDDEQ
ncbi:MAG: hypothetical protein ACOYXC_16260 [Candidatus Rifleibacteriota bacterium]